jgi:hypothetical protein
MFLSFYNVYDLLAHLKRIDPRLYWVRHTLNTVMKVVLLQKYIYQPKRQKRKTLGRFYGKPKAQGMLLRRPCQSSGLACSAQNTQQMDGG